VLGRLFKSGNLSLIQNITAHLIARLLGGALEAVSECPTLSENLAHAGDVRKREPVRFVLIDLPISVVYVALSLNWLVWLARLRCAHFRTLLRPALFHHLALAKRPFLSTHPGPVSHWPLLDRFTQHRWTSWRDLVLSPTIAFTRLDGLPGIVKLRRRLYLIQDLS
jgi:hypothetical protein